MLYLGHERWRLNQTEEFIAHRYEYLQHIGFSPVGAIFATFTSMRGAIDIHPGFVLWLTDGLVTIDLVTYNLVISN